MAHDVDHPAKAMPTRRVGFREAKLAQNIRDSFASAPPLLGVAKLQRVGFEVDEYQGF